MNKICLLLCCLLPGLFRAGAQELKMTECAPLTQIYGEVCESDELLPMGDVGGGIRIRPLPGRNHRSRRGAALELENVRDYAAVYLDGVFQGTLTDNRKTLTLKAEPGRHIAALVENIGRITYGPEILDNSKATLRRSLASAAKRSPAGRSPRSKCATPIPKPSSSKPSARATRPVSGAGSSTVRRTKEPFTSTCRDGGMGEVWINGHYLRLVLGRGETAVDPHSGRNPRRKGNRIVVFDLKNNDPGATMRLSDKPVFK